jgi:hypothetical protein
VSYDPPQAEYPYRSVHVPGPLRRSESKIGAPWLLLSEQEIAEWMIRHPEATCGERTARMLAWLELEFGQLERDFAPR